MANKISRLLLLAAGGLVAAAAPAQPQPQTEALGPVLWGNLRVGMTKQQVRALYPKSKVALTTGCNGKLSYFWENNKLARVAIDPPLLGSGTAVNCGLIIAASLNAKYGPPQNEDVDRQTRDCGDGKLGNLCEALGGGNPIRWRLTQWIHDGISINLRLEDTTTSPLWTVVYAPPMDVTVDEAIKL